MRITDKTKNQLFIQTKEGELRILESAEGLVIKIIDKSIMIKPLSNAILIKSDN